MRQCDFESPDCVVKGDGGCGSPDILREGLMQDAISVAEMLSKARPGDERTMDALLPLVYAELKLLAARQLGRESSGRKSPTLQPTALVHEAFLKMVGN